MKQDSVFDDIANKYYQSIYNYCFVRLNNEQSAKDCTQEIFLILYKKMDKLDLSENIRAWLYRTADNIIKNYLKNIKYNLSTDDENTPEIAVEDIYNEEQPLKGIVNSDELSLLTSYYIDGTDINTLSRKTGKSESAIYKRLERLKNKIRKNIYKDDS